MTRRMLTTKKAIYLSGAVIAAMIFAGLVFWPSLPSVMAVHWNAAGVANGTSGKVFGVFFVPLLAATMAALLFWLPSADPIAKGFKAFRKEYDGLILLLVGFLAVVQGLVLAWNLGARFDLIRVLGPGIGFLCYYIGSIMPSMKRNHFAGIRTPWTLSSDRVWNKTHRLGGRLFRVSGLLAGLGGVFTDYALPLILIPIGVSALWATVYSYIEYREKP